MNCQPGKLRRCKNGMKEASQPIADDAHPTSEEANSPKSVSSVRERVLT